MMKTNKMTTEFNKSNVILRQNEVSTNNENTCKHKKTNTDASNTNQQETERDRGRWKQDREVNILVF